MAVSSVGIGSGLPVEKLVTQMVDLERKPLDSLKKRAEGINTQISAYGEIKSLTAKLGDLVSKLTRDSAWNVVNISSSNTAITGTMTGIAAVGSFKIDVVQLAQAKTSVIRGSDVRGVEKDARMDASGTLNLSVGDKSKAIKIDANDTLTKIAEKVNNAGAGVQATVVTSASGHESLMLRSKETGVENAFSLGSPLFELDPVERKGNESDADFQARQDKVANSVLKSLAEVADAGQEAKNAVVKLNNVEVQSPSNTFDKTLPGMSFSVNQTTTQSAILNVKADTDGVKKTIQEFVDAYNELNAKLAELTKYDDKTKTSGALQGDSATVSLQNSLRSLVMGYSGSSGAFKRLADIGIQMEQGGKLSVDDGKLTKGLAKLDDLKDLFAKKPDALGQGGGIAVNFKNFTDKLLAFDGTLNNKTDSLDKTYKNNLKDQDKVNARADNLEVRLYKQYSALDGKMASINALGSYVNQMVTSWNKSKE